MIYRTKQLAKSICCCYAKDIADAGFESKVDADRILIFLLDAVVN